MQTMGDYPGDYAPAMNALLAGHLQAFFAHLPTNGAGGSVLMRAPAALLGRVLVGTQHATFRFGALLCLLALGALGLWLARDMRSRGRPELERAALMGICLLAPAVLDAILFGHPEEPLGAALCVAAVLAAASEHPVPAGVLLALAIINKPWGVLAVGPTLAAMPAQRRRALLIATGIVGAWTAAGYAFSPHHFSRIVLGASTSVVAHPVDLWWPLARLHVVPGITHAYLPPPFIAAHARELAVVLALPLTLALLRRRDRRLEDCLALLALLFCLRCLLDPSNHVYYQLPFVVALAAWESRTRGFPALALAALAGFFLVFHTVAGIGTLDQQFVAYLTITLPLVAVLLHAVLGSGAPRGYRPVDDRHRSSRQLPRAAASASR